MSASSEAYKIALYPCRYGYSVFCIRIWSNFFFIVSSSRFLEKVHNIIIWMRGLTLLFCAGCLLSFVIWLNKCIKSSSSASKRRLLYRFWSFHLQDSPVFCYLVRNFCKNSSQPNAMKTSFKSFFQTIYGKISLMFPSSRPDLPVSSYILLPSRRSASVSQRDTSSAAVICLNAVSTLFWKICL